MLCYMKTVIQCYLKGKQGGNMKKLIISLLFLTSVVYGANVKWTAQTELTAIADNDQLLVVDTTASASRRITVLNFFDTIDTSLKLLTILTNETGSGLAVFATSPTFTTSIVMGAADMSEADLEKLDGITNGTAAANKALVADASIDIDLGTGDFDCTNLVVDGTTNIIGATTLGTATTVAGNLSLFDAGTLTIYEDGDNFNITLACISGEAVGLLTGGLDISAALGVTGIVVLGDGGDNFSVASDGIDISSGGAITNAIGIVSTGDIDFGGADLELPQGQTPDTDGDVDLDFTDGSLVIQHGSAHAELASATDVVMGKLIKSFSATIFAPDGVNDVIPVKPIVSGEFPHGIVVTEVHMVVGTDTNYTIDVENWDDFDTISAGNPSINSTAYTSGNNGEVTDSAITFATIAAGQIIMIDIPATDIDWVSITIFYYEPIS